MLYVKVEDILNDGNNQAHKASHKTTNNAYAERHADLLTGIPSAIAVYAYSLDTIAQGQIFVCTAFKQQDWRREDMTFVFAARHMSIDIGATAVKLHNERDSKIGSTYKLTIEETRHNHTAQSVIVQYSGSSSAQIAIICGRKMKSRRQQVSCKQRGKKYLKRLDTDLEKAIMVELERLKSSGELLEKCCFPGLDCSAGGEGIRIRGAVLEKLIRSVDWLHCLKQPALGRPFDQAAITLVAITDTGDFVGTAEDNFGAGTHWTLAVVVGPSVDITDQDLRQNLRDVYRIGCWTIGWLDSASNPELRHDLAPILFEYCSTQSTSLTAPFRFRLATWLIWPVQLG
ncbi:hypothetical protein V8E36_006230 [Tilletia maclaganii]